MCGDHIRVTAEDATTVTQETLGGVIRLPGSQEVRALLAGHVARAKGRSVTVTLGKTVLSLGTVSEVVLGPDGDAAWAGPVHADVTQIVKPATGIRTLRSADIFAELRVRVPWDFSGRMGSVDSVLVALTRAITTPGDSGAPAVDFKGRVAGFVVGVWGGKTYLMPARRALDLLDS